MGKVPHGHFGARNIDQPPTAGMLVRFSNMATGDNKAKHPMTEAWRVRGFPLPSLSPRVSRTIAMHNTLDVLEILKHFLWKVFKFSIAGCQQGFPIGVLDKQASVSLFLCLSLL